MKSTPAAAATKNPITSVASVVNDKKSSSKRKSRSSIVDDDYDTDDQYDDDKNDHKHKRNSSSKLIKSTAAEDEAKADPTPPRRSPVAAATTNKSSSNTPVTTMAKKAKAKAHYPLIQLKEQELRKFSASSSGGDKEALQDVVSFVCEQEAKQLREYFKRNYPERKALLAALERVTTQLPLDIDSNVADNVVFAEDAAQEGEAAHWTAEIERLEAESTRLAAFEQDMESFLEAYKIYNAAAQEVVPVESIEASTRRYADSLLVLQGIEANSGVVMEEVHRMNALMSEAWRMQEQLYSSFQIQRSEDLLKGRYAPSKPQDLLRGLTKL